MREPKKNALRYDQLTPDEHEHVRNSRDVIRMRTFAKTALIATVPPVSKFIQRPGGKSGPVTRIKPTPPSEDGNL